MKRLLLVVLPLFLTCLAPLACSLRRGAEAAPIAPEATHALAEARELVRARAQGWRARAQAAAERAAHAAPEWIAPRRVLDDLEREELLGHQALEARMAALEPAATAPSLYLAGRLQGRAGSEHLARAAALDPSLSWAQHGLAWQRFQAGDARGALRAGRRAIELARGSYELGFFAAAEARYLLDLARVDEAVESLEEALADARLVEPERTELEVALARAELESDDPEDVERGFWRAVTQFERARLSSEEYEDLGAEVLARHALAGQPDALSVLLAALEHGRGAARERLRARVLAERGEHSLAGALWERASETGAAGAFQRARDLERGAAERALERWRVALPARLKDEHGLPREPALCALVQAARASGDDAGALRFGQALLDAGWFAEAESWASALVERDPEAALALSGRAAAGQALLSGLRGLLERIDDERAVFVPVRDGAPGRAREIGQLDELLAAMQPFFERFHGAPLEHELTASPRLSFGAFASIVHPGPRFSALDGEQGLGAGGQSVPGLAAELARIGRFGIFGQAPGGSGPDGTVLRVVGGEWKSGAHLGVPFAGWVAWCEGADIQSRPGRLGAGVSGAALHEGYWIDLEHVRRDWERLRALERKVFASEPERRARALAGRGPRLAPRAGPHENTRWMTPLGEGERVLLAVWNERAAPAGDEGRIGFEEELALTALHEEGHLTDRTRFLPLASRWRAVLGFLLRYGFAPQAVARALEYRAELVALCAASEPRLALADCLAAADSEGGPLVHGEAYRELLEDFLATAAAELERLPALDPNHYLLYQLHFLTGDEVRRIALALAAKNGMVAE